MNIFKSLISGLLISTCITFSVQAENLPISRVVLSTSGMANFEHSGKVDGNTVIELPVRSNQVDDILKSLVIFDAKGSISGVTLPSKKSLNQIFRDLPFNKKDLQSNLFFLNSYQGAEVIVDDGDDEIEGKLISLKKFKVKLDNDEGFISHHNINLLTEDGIKQVILEDITSIKFKDEKITDEIKKALNEMLNNGNSDEKLLKINLQGDDKRSVKIAYVMEAPLWKSAYRIVLSNDKSKSFVQGWAVLENTTNSDWENIDLSLVSGNPVTYSQSLYEPYFVSRPSLPVEVLGRIMPRIDTGTIEEQYQNAAGPKKKSNYKSRARSKADMQFKDSMMGFAAGAPPMPMADMELTESVSIASAPMKQNIIAQNYNAAASSEATTQVLFNFPNKFSLKSGETMMLPFVSRNLPMENIALYQADTHPTHPLASVKITNDGNSGLPPGILTIYEDSNSKVNFIGDAKLPVLSKGDDRLVSYALDSKTTINKEVKNIQKQGAISIANGVIKQNIKYISETIYTIKAPESEDRLIMIEHPKMHGYKMVEPVKFAKTDKYYRIKLPIEQGKTIKQKVILAKDGYNNIRISNLSYQALSAYAAGKNGKFSKNEIKIFENIANLKLSVERAKTSLNQLNSKKDKIFKDQNRLRDNMRAIPNNSDVKKRYLKKFNNQENQLEDINMQSEKLQKELNTRTAKLEEFIRNIKL